MKLERDDEAIAGVDSSGGARRTDHRSRMRRGEHADVERVRQLQSNLSRVDVLSERVRVERAVRALLPDQRLRQRDDRVVGGAVPVGRELIGDAAD